ncbi:MAG: hypothetical protein ABFC96_16325 [Thermoguttaceae bacterium]
MFRLHDTTRRRICVSGFLLLGVLPMLLMAGWCTSRHLPGRARFEARQLAARIGLAVKLEGIRYLRPGAVLYEKIELADPETGQTVLRCRLLEVAAGRETDEHGKSRPMLSISASQPQVEAAAIPRLWLWLQSLLASRLGQIETDVQLAAGEVTLRGADGSQTLTDLHGILEQPPGGTRAEIHFRLVGADTPEPARIRLVRNRQVSPPASGFELYTGGGELPCNVLAMGLDALQPLGPRCRFRGYIWANETPDGWQGEVTGQLVDLDFGRLVSDHFPHRMSGVGELIIQSARFHRGRLEEGSGFLTVGPGMIDRGLMAAAVERLGLRPAANASLLEKSRSEDALARNELRPTLPAGRAHDMGGDVNKRLPYDQLAVSVTLDSQGLRLRGRCVGTEPGTILRDSRGRLLGEPEQAPRPVASLVQTLVPRSVVLVPASRQTDWLLRHLPLPDVISPVGAESATPVARPRLPDRLQR